MPLWTATIELSPELARELIAEQFPELGPVSLTFIGTGWDNTAFLVNDTFVFRFPRREIAVPLLERETQILPLIAPHLPDLIPVPCFSGKPTGRFPYPFAGYSYLPGQTADRVAWTGLERSHNAESLGRFLQHLHHIPVSADTLSWAPGDEIQRADMQKRASNMKERFQKVAERLDDIDLDTLWTTIDTLKETPPYAGPPCWVQGDLYPRHLLVDNRHRFCGVIDWGDVHIGDPALDLSIAFTFLPPEAWSLFQKSYGGIEQATWDRARFRALSYAGILFLYGEDVSDPAMQALGEFACRNALRD